MGFGDSASRNDRGSAGWMNGLFELATQDRIKSDGGRDHHVGGVGAHDKTSS
jgi:hypothetical protein